MLMADAEHVAPCRSETRCKTRLSSVDDLILAYEKRSGWRDALLDVWNVDTAQALRMCDERQVEVCESDVTDISLPNI